jgi:rod shape-determining protein MreC
LRKENDHLKGQNLLLLKQLSSNFVINTDSIYSQNTPNLQGKSVRIFDYISANVIYNSINKTHNYIIIDKGYDDSIQVDMAVFSPEGVLGIVNDVSAHFATVMSVLHPNTMINAKLMPAAQVGTVSWEGGDPDHVYLSYIPQHTEVNIGDTVFTSGYSNIFPKDILIGFVNDIDKKSNDSFIKIKIKLSVDFSNLNSVFVVKSIYKEEIDQLKANFINE